MKKTILSVSIVAFVLIFAHAETRDPNSFHTPEKLKKMSALVFTGTVSKIETNKKYKVSFPVEAKVDKVVKGKLKNRKLSFKHKNPGRSIIIEKEFNTPEVGQKGTFYIQKQGKALVLIGYIKRRSAGIGPRIPAISITEAIKLVLLHHQKENPKGEEVFVDEAVYIRDTGESYWKVGLRQRKQETGHLYYKVTSTKKVSGLCAVKDG
jgi:hypothetical protein